MDITFATADIQFRVPQKKKLSEFIPNIFKGERKPWDTLNIIFCSDKYLLKINKDYLAHDYYTDIITFDLSSSEEGKLGEIYISVDRVRENAKENHVSCLGELRRVVFHGILHLCGYKDSTPKLKAQIHNKEDQYLALYKSFDS